MHATTYQMVNQRYWINWRWPEVSDSDRTRRNLYFADGTRIDRLDDEQTIRAKGVNFSTAKAACAQLGFDGILYVPLDEIWFIPNAMLSDYQKDYPRWRRLGSVFKYCDPAS